MKQVAKLIVIDPTDHYLMMHRSDHPSFPDDPDLPGGTVEDDESVIDALLREVVEEAGISLAKGPIEKLYEGNEYSAHHTHYSLYQVRLDERPEVTISWEHSSHGWLTREDFLEKSKSAKDTYMHMVYDVLNRAK